MRYIHQIVLFCLLILIGCVDYDDANKAPVIEGVVADLSIVTGNTITLTLTQVKAYDEGGDKLTLIVGGGENYTVQGTTVVPTPGFIGDLTVPLSVSDGELTSGTVYIIISVIKEIEMFPLLPGAWWQYRDSVLTEGTVLTSNMSVTGASTISIGLETIPAVHVEWSHLAEYGVTYLMGSTTRGTFFYGGYAPTDTVLEASLLYPYPVTVGQTWQSKIPEYNASDNAFEPLTPVSAECTRELVYIEVPAGIFPCYEYLFTYSASRGETVMRAKLPSRAGVVVEILYFSPGVGYVKGVITQGGYPVWVKELMDYHVVEAE